MFTSLKTSSQVILLMCSALFLFSACSERKPMTAEEKWQRFCITYQSAAYNIMSDRQHQVTEQQAIEHVEKIQAGVERDMLIALVKQAHQSPAFDQQDDKEKAMEDFKAGKYQACMAKMPESSEAQNADIPTAPAP